MDQSSVQQNPRAGEGGKPRVLDLFAGCGGLSLGFHSAGFNLICGVELDPPAAESYALNFHNNSPPNLKEIHARPRDIIGVEPDALRWMSAELQPNAYLLRCSTIRWWRIRQKIQGEKPSYITPTRMGYPSFGVSGSAGTSASPAGGDRRDGGGGCVRYPGPGPGARSVSAPDPPAARGPRPFRPCGGTHFHTRGGRNTRSGSGARRPYSRSRATPRWGNKRTSRA